MVKKRSDFSAITTLDGAKNTNYNGQPLTDAEKVIFDSPLLKKKKTDGTLDTNPDLDNLRDTMALLDNLKKAQAELPKEQSSSEENLSTEGNGLLIEFLNERRKDSVAYQAVNTYANSEQVDKIIKDYQKVEFRKENKSLKAEERAVLIALNSIKKEGEKQDEKIKKARKEMEERMSIAEAKEYKIRVQSIVNALKADLATGQTGYNILHRAAQTQENVAKVIYQKDSSDVPNSWGSIIKTSIANPYSDKQYTHPTYLSEGLPWQMRELFEQFDKDKLFALIDKKFSGDTIKVKKIKTSFERVLGAYVAPGANKFFPEIYLDETDDEKAGDFSLAPLEGKDIPNYEVPEGSELLVPPTEKEAREWNLCVSDVLYFMDALFPQGTTDFSTSIDFLKVGNDALPFADSKNTLTTKHDVFWRGREDNTLGGVASYRDKFPTEKYPREKAFPSKKLQLSWAGPKGESIPEFFWQVYDKPEATQFDSSQGAYKEVVDKKGNPKRVWENDISVYEKKLISWKVGSNADFHFMAYVDRVKDIMKGTEPITGHVLANNVKFSDDELVKYWTDFELVCHKILTETFRTFHHFREIAEQTTYQVLKSDGRVIPYMIENTKADVDADVVNIWNKMIDEVCDGKIANAEQFRNNWTAELTARNEINVREDKAEKKLKEIQNKIKGLANGKVTHLRVQFATLGEKLKAAPVTNLRTITPGEAASMHTLYHLLQKLEGVDNLPDIPNLVFADGTTVNYTPQTYMTVLKALEDRWDGINKGAYGVWKGLGSSFADRLAKWQKNEGKNLDEDAIKAYLLVVKTSINEIKKYRHLSPEENVDLNAIETYLTKVPELREVDIQLAFSIEADIEKTLVDKWKTYGDQNLFATDSIELKKLGDIVNNLSDDDKNTFFTQLKTYLTGKSGVPTMLDDTADEQDKLEYFFTLDPEHVIGAIATYQIKNNSTIKTDTENAMSAAKDPADNTKDLDLTVYGDGTNITEAGIIKFRGEELGGISHSFSSQQGPHQHIPPTPQKWYEKFGYWPLWGSALLIGALTIAYFKRDSISEWWNGSAEEEGDNEEEQED